MEHGVVVHPAVRRFRPRGRRSSRLAAATAAVMLLIPVGASASSSDLAIDAVLTHADLTQLYTGVIVGDQGYFGTLTNPARVVRVDLSTMTVVGTLTLTGESDLKSVVTDGTHLYFGTWGYPARVIKVALTGGAAEAGQMSRVGALVLDGTNGTVGTSILWSAVTDGTHIFFGTSAQNIVRVRMSDLAFGGALALESGESNLTTAATDGTHAYFGTQSTERIVKVRMSDFTRVGGIAVTGSGGMESSVVVPSGDLFVGSGSMAADARILRISTSGSAVAGSGGMSLVGTLALPATEGRPMAAFVKGDVYFATAFNSPGPRLLRIATGGDLSTAGGMSVADELSLAAHGSALSAFTPASSASLAYIGTVDTVLRIDLAATPPVTAPGTPGKPSATAGDGAATVTVVAPGSGGTPDSYTVTAAPGGATCSVSGAAGSCTVSGLTNGDPYTFTVTATNTGGTSAASAASDPVTPLGTAFVPTFGAPAATADGFVVSITNYLAGSSFAWSTSGASATIGAGGDLTVTGLAPGASATVTVTTMRPGFASGSATVTGAAAAAPAPVPDPPVAGAHAGIGMSCSPRSPGVGTTVTCDVAGGDSGATILWRATSNPVIASDALQLDADGSGSFRFVVPVDALGAEILVELVDWMAPVSLGVVVHPVPSAVNAGGGPAPQWWFLNAMLGLLLMATSLRRPDSRRAPAGLLQPIVAARRA